MLVEVLLLLILLAKVGGLIMQWRDSHTIAAMNRRTEEAQSRWAEYQKQREADLDAIRQEELRSLREMMAELAGMRLIAEGLIAEGMKKESPDA